MIDFLQKYIQINTAVPKPDYYAAVALFEQQAKSDGFTCQKVILPSGNPVLIITYEGSDASLPALVLNHHMDVVPVSNVTEWKFPPFAGVVHDHKIFGRGTQDMKGVGVVHYFALQGLKKRNINLERTVHVIIVPDEERGGFLGTKEFVAHEVFDTLNIGYVLDEGMPSGDNEKILIKVAERTPIQIKLVSKGLMGHASNLHHQNSAHELICLLHDVVKFHKGQQKIEQDPGMLLSMNITSLYSNNTALNVIPSISGATIDIRVPSNCSLEDALKILELMLKKYSSITYEILATSIERCSIVSETSLFYQACAAAIVQSGKLPKSFAFQATTDARFYSHKGNETIGLTPFVVASNLHGTNEYIYLADLELGKNIIGDFLQKFCKK